MFSFFRNEFKDNLKRTCYSINFNPISQPYSVIEFEYSFENDEVIIKNFNTSVHFNSDTDSTYGGSKRHIKTSHNSDFNNDIYHGSYDSDSRSSCGSRSSDD